MGFLCHGIGTDIRDSIPGTNRTVRLYGPPLNCIVGALIFLPPGAGCLWGAGIGSLQFLSQHDFARAVGWLVSLGLFGSVFTFVGALLLYIAFDASRCLSINALSKRLNVSEEALVKAAREKGVYAPRYSIQGRAVYRPGDFDSGQLLRASEMPVKSEELLRAGFDTQTPPNQLLRESTSPSLGEKAD